MEDDKREKDITKSVKAFAKDVDNKLGVMKGIRGSKDLGLCSDCSELQAVMSKFGSRLAACETFNRRLNPTDPVVECTKYWQNDQPTVKDMVGIAYIIELGRKIGFGDDE